MTNFQILNTASDLRRAANWLGRNQTEKIPLIMQSLKEAEKNHEIFSVLKHFNVSRKLVDEDRRFLADQLLAVSIRLQNNALVNG